MFGYMGGDAINQEMFDSMTDGMTLRQLLSFVPGLDKNFVNDIVSNLNK